MKKILIGLTPVLLFMSSSAMAAPPWKVSEVSGDVRVVENGRPRAALRGALLASGATIVTGQSARAVIVRGGEFVVVSPNSRLRIAEPAQQGGIIQAIAEFGTSLFRIERKATPHFGVQTPYLAAVVKGTVFTVTVGGQGASVQVTEGAVQVSTLDGGASDLIRPGMIASVGASDRYQLNVQGESAKVIRSEGAPPAGTVGASSPPPGQQSDGPAQESAPAARIEDPMPENPVSLNDVTAGLVEGNPVDLALVEIRQDMRSRDGGSGGGSSGGSDNGNGNGGDNANGGGSGGSGSGGGSDNGNGGGSGGSGSGSGSDNGNGGGSGSGGGGGSDNGNGGGSGSGNGNGGSGGGGSDNGNGGSGSGNGNGGGSDNGNGGGNGGGGSGSGTGSDNGNGGGSGSGGGSDNGNTGSGSGSGNGNGGGSDNGNGGGSGSGGSGSGSGNGGGSDNGNGGSGSGSGGGGGSGSGGGSDNGNGGSGSGSGSGSDNGNGGGSGSGSGGGSDNGNGGGTGSGGGSDNGNGGSGSGSGGGQDDGGDGKGDGDGDGDGKGDGGDDDKGGKGDKDDAKRQSGLADLLDDLPAVTPGGSPAGDSSPQR